MKRLTASLLLALLCKISVANAAQISVRVNDAPVDGVLVFQVYDDANAFADFRDPISEVRYPVQSSGSYVIADVPEGDVAVLVYLDENSNRALDKNFIGIPKEPLGLSNNYRPKGPPSFQRASFPIASGETVVLDIGLYRVLGNFGQWGVGLGVIGRSSPYLDSNTSVTKVIPAVTYFGERLQWVGPQLRYGLVGSEGLRLALVASYRIGVYEEDDSPALEGLGDREDTLLGGLGLVYEAPGGVDLNFRYEHDLLDRIGGGVATVGVSKGFQFGVVRLAPNFGVNWLSKDLGNYDFGVPESAAQPGRPAYSVGDSVNLEVGFGGLVEISEDWRVAFNFAVEYLDDEITDSPIVDDDRVIKGFAALTYTF
jgi:outer membrane protein